MSWDTLSNLVQERQQLKEAVKNYLKKIELENGNNNRQIIQKLKLRLSLIDNCHQMSLQRLGHLQDVFKHYCTHIFRTGKYMTFDRLQYQKVHLTMDRYFYFLKDFGLTTALINQKPTEIMDKNIIIIHFKKISSNSKVLSFQQFITCLQKLAVIYFDQKQNYLINKEKEKQRRQKNKQQYQKKKKLRLQKQLKQKKQPQNKNQQNVQKEQKLQQKQKEPPIENNQENNQLINEMMNNQNLQDPNEQLKKILDQNKQKQQEKKQQQLKKKSIYSDQMLLILTKNEKIQYYYQLMKIDNVNQYRFKMGELNFPNFNLYSKQSEGPKHIYHQPKINTQKKSQPKIEQSQPRDQQKQERIQALKEKLNQKKNKQKSMPIPKPKNDQSLVNKQQERKKKLQEKKERFNLIKLNKQENDALIQKKKDIKKNTQKKSIQFNQKQINWNIMNVSLEQLKLRQFNPLKFCPQQDQDKIYLQQYGVDNTQRVRVSSGIEIRQRQSISVVQNAKKRAIQIQQTQKNIQKNLNKISKKLGQNQLVRGKF